MALRYTQTDYLYVSARIRAREATLPPRDALSSLIELETVEEIAAALVQQGFPPVLREDGTHDPEAMLTVKLEAELRAVKEATGDPAVTAPFTLPYDCHNAKSVLKCRARGIAPHSMLLPLGSVHPDTLIKAFEEQDYRALSPKMAAAVPEATEAFSRTGDPREIDFILDRACFADLCTATAGFPFARELVAKKADLTNILICLRLIRDNNDYLSAALLPRVMVEGGTLGEAFFLSALKAGEAELANMLVTTPYGQVLQTGSPRTLAAVEKNADELIAATLGRVRYVPFGAQIPMAYLLSLEGLVKNLRIVLAGKAAGLPADTIRARVRNGYV